MTAVADRFDGARPVAVIGGGSWGTALAIHVARMGTGVRLWMRDGRRAAAIQASRRNERYLPEIALPSSIRITAVPGEALPDAGLVIIAVPSHGLAEVLRLVAADVEPGAVLLSAVKGLDPGGGRRMSELLAELLPRHPVAVLSGPSFAAEVARGLPAALVVAATDEDVARRVQRRLSSREFRLYTSRDVAGVELGGALKNVIAIAAGLSDSLGLGDSARAALITRGLAEITRVGVALGASGRTFAGLAGVGDLVLTCTSALSRNRTLGLAVGAGRSLGEAEASTPMIAEGVRTVSAALSLARGAAVPVPIFEAVAAVLYRGVPAAAALTTLLGRELRPEDEAAPQHA